MGKIYEKVMHFCVHNTFMITSVVILFTHLCLLLITSLADVRPLAYCNVLSVVVYLFCFLLCKVGYYIPVYFSVLIEITSYSIIGVWLTGWQGSSAFFLCTLVPIIIYFGFNLLNPYKRGLIALLLLSNFSIFCILYFNFRSYKPPYVLDENVEFLLFLLTMFAMVFSTIFYNIIYIYSAEYKRRSLENSNKLLTEDANTDNLTGLLNRRGFLPLLKAVHFDIEVPSYSLAFCDIDDFKKVNDTYGHEGGDEILKNVTKIIKRTLGNTVDICRWGGEELVILLPNCNLEQAKNEMNLVRTEIEQYTTVFYNKHINVTMTIGVAEKKECADNPEDVIKMADERMYWGKTHGKNQVVAL